MCSVTGEANGYDGNLSASEADRSGEPCLPDERSWHKPEFGMRPPPPGINISASVTRCHSLRRAINVSQYRARHLRRALRPCESIAAPASASNSTSSLTRIIHPVGHGVPTQRPVVPRPFQRSERPATPRKSSMRRTECGIRRQKSCFTVIPTSPGNRTAILSLRNYFTLDRPHAVALGKIGDRFAVSAL